MTRRIAFLWFEALSIERFFRHHSVNAPFALSLHEKNAERIYALNAAGQRAGLAVGMGLSDARSFCTNLQTAQAAPDKDQKFLYALARFAQSYCPWVGIDHDHGLALDMTGSAHLWGGEAGFIKKAKADFARFGITVKIGVAPTRGAAWALAHFREGMTENCRDALYDLPIAALRVSEKDEVLARRLGLTKIGALYDKPRAEMARRFGQGFLLKLDQALGAQFENISPIGEPRIFATRMNFPEPIGLLDDVMEGISRLLDALSQRLIDHDQAMQALAIGLRMVDGKWHHLNIRFARPMRQTTEVLPLVEPKIAALDAGFGFDLIRVEAKVLSQWSASQMAGMDSDRAFHDLLSKIGNRIGFENIQKLVPHDSHLPEKATRFAPYDKEVANVEIERNPRPLLLFAPEWVRAKGTTPPQYFTWRRMKFHTGKAVGPERIAPEWWCEDEAWRSGVRDYWRVATLEGRRLWMFYTPQSPAWYVHGEFA